MATGTPDVHNWSDSSTNTQAIEYGMSGMSLLDNNDHANTKGTASTVSSSSPEEASHHHYSSSDHSMHSYLQQQQQRPSPIGKPSKNTPTLTLTPNSSIDGDWNSATSSVAYMDAPSLPFLHQQHHQHQRRGSDGQRSVGGSSLGEPAPVDNDGLLGLHIRERAYSSSPRMYDRSSRPPLYTEGGEWGGLPGAGSGLQQPIPHYHPFDRTSAPQSHLPKPQGRHTRSLSQPGLSTPPHLGGFAPRHSFQHAKSTGSSGQGLSSSYDSQRAKYMYSTSPPPPMTASHHEYIPQHQQPAPSHFYHHHHHRPEDAALMGEHIEVPAEYLRPKIVYSVKFKRTQRNFCLGPRLLGQRDLKIGTYVKVEADRGEDLGIVVAKTHGPVAAAEKRIIRLATHDEVSLLQIKLQEEDDLLQICRQKVRQRGLPMHVVDAEYQFDRHKLTFFFEAEGRVDFRELVRDLFSMYKTRIWMQQLDKTTSSSTASALQQQSEYLQPDYGTPIIAPEFADLSSSGGILP